MSIGQLIEEAEQKRRSGDDLGALKLLLEAARLARDAFEPALEAQALLEVGQLRALSGRLRLAREAFGDAAARAMEAGDALLEADAHFGLATASFDEGRSKDGHDALLEAMALYRQLDGRPAQLRLARATRLYGEHIGVLGSVQDAREALELARIMFEALGESEQAAGVAEDMRQLDRFSR